jgi:hypothetical protein
LVKEIIMTESILTSTKKMLGLSENYDVFDQDIIICINSAFSTLHQLGIGPLPGFYIQDDHTEWPEYTLDDPRFNSVKAYVYLRVRLLFDPPQTSFHLAAMQEQAKELEWRLNVLRETLEQPHIADLPVIIDGNV